MTNTLIEIILVMVIIILTPITIFAILTLLKGFLAIVAMILNVVVEVSTKDNLEEEDNK